MGQPRAKRITKPVKPRRPTKPQRPSKHLEKVVEVLNYRNSISFENLLKDITETGISFNKLRVEPIMKNHLSITTTVSYENPLYQHQFIAYKAAIETYNKNMEAYQAKLFDYNLKLEAYNNYLAEKERATEAKKRAKELKLLQELKEKYEESLNGSNASDSSMIVEDNNEVL